MSSSSKEGILGVCGCLLGLTTIAVALRFYVRKKTHISIMADDLLAVASWVRAMADCCRYQQTADMQ